MAAGLLGPPAEAGTLDTVIFGNPSSEQAHGLVQQYTNIITGGMGQPARKLLPDPVVFTPTESGYLDFTVRCDPVNDNYVTLKLWGSEKSNSGSLVVYQIVNGMLTQVGYRSMGLDNRFAPLSWGGWGTAPIPNRFYYTTVPLPLSLTQGKTSVELRVVCAWIGAAGSDPVYRAYVHTGSYFEPAADDPQGMDPGPRPLHPPSIDTDVSIIQARNAAEANLTALLASGSGGNISDLASGYNTAGSVAYHNPQIVTMITAQIDTSCKAYFANPSSVGGAWGGAYGGPGEILRQIGAAAFGSSLDAVVDLGDPAGPAARRVLWSKMLKASRDWGRMNRRGPTTNQAIISDNEVYKANKGLQVLGSADAFPESQILRYLLEACGLQPWLGSDNADGTPSAWMGNNYYLVTPAGLTKEDGYVSTYGEVYNVVAGYYTMTGDTRFRDQAVKMLRARSPFRYPMVDMDGYRNFQMIGPLDWRGQQAIPQDWAYGERRDRVDVSTATLDPYAVGYAKQLFADNQGISSALLKAAPDSGQRLPMGAGQPDFAWADVDNGVVAIKRGEELTWIEPYWQSRHGLHSTGRAMQITPTAMRVAHLRTDLQFASSQAWQGTPDTANYFGDSTPYTTANGVVHQAYYNEKIVQAMNPLNPTSTREEFAGRAAFYAARYGRYLVGINMHRTKPFVLKTPPGFTSALELISRQTLSGTITVAPFSAVVLDLGTNVDATPVPGVSRYLLATGAAGQVMLYWDGVAGAASYNLKRSTAPGGPYTTVATGIGGTYPQQWGVWPYATYIDKTAAAGTTYYYVVSGVNTNGEGYNSPESAGATSTASVNTLPSPWANQDIGAMSPAGNATYNAGLNNGTFNITAGGGNIWNNADILHYLYQPLVGDGTIVARVLSQAGGKTGVMFRNSLDPASVQVNLATATNAGIKFEFRYSTGSGSAGGPGTGAAGAAPYWLKLQRAGQAFTASISPDNLAWTVLGTLNMAHMNQAALVGLSVSNNSVVDNVTVTQATPAVPDAPGGLAATAGNGQVSLSWGPASRASTYTVKRGNASGGPYNTIVASGLTSLSATDSAATNGTPYYYIATAVNAHGESALSAEVSATPAATAPTPASPSVTVTGTTAAITWATSSGAASYTILRSIDGVAWQVLASGVTGTAYTDSGLSAGQSYYYSVAAVNGNGASAPTGAVLGTAIPSTPALESLDSRATLATIIWQPVTGASGYNVWRCPTGAGTYSEVGSNIHSTTFVDAGLTRGADYYYQVSAINAAGESPPSVPVKLGWGTGLLAQYYNSSSFSGAPVLTRAEPVVGANWGSGSPSLAVNTDNFSVRLTGQLEAPATDTYTFTGNADDTITVYINGTVLLTKGQTASIALTAGQKYDFTVEFSEITGAASYSLTWSNSAMAAQPIPTSRLYPATLLVNRATGGTATGLGGTGTETPPSAFDGNTATKWYGGANGAGWVAYQFAPGTSWAITQYEISSANDVPQRDPAAWQFLGSNDGTHWTTLDTQAGATFASRFQTNIYRIANTTAFSYYKLNITANAGGAGYNVQLSELGLYSPDPLLAGPLNLLASSGTSQVTLNWTAVSGATGYNVSRSESTGGPYSELADGVTATTYTDTGLPDGQTWYYVVSAITPDRVGTNSAEAAAAAYATPPQRPGGLSATPGDAQVLLAWPPDTGATAFTVFRTTTSGTNYKALATQPGTSYTDTTAANGTLYYYAVSASNPAGASLPSTEASAIPSPPISAAESIAPGIAFSGTNSTLTVKASVSGQSYQLQYRDDLASGAWQNLGPSQYGTGGDLHFTGSPVTGVKRRFYRIFIQR